MKRMVTVSASGAPEITETLQWGATIPSMETWDGLARTIRQGRAHGGCVIVSRDDRGRTSLLRGLLEAKEPEQPSLTISGSRYSQGIAYGAMMFLVAGLAEPLTSDPGVILDGFRNQLRTSDHDAPTILVVERPGLLDSHSSMALAQLALRRDVVLVVTCRGTGELGDDLGAVWRADELVQIELVPLTLERAIAHIEGRLGGRISRHAGARLWRHCHGSPEGLDGLVDECLSTEKLRHFQDAWVLEEGALPQLPAAMTGAGQHAVSQTAIDLLASMAGGWSLAVDAVVGAGGLDALDELFQADLARYSNQIGMVESTDAAGAYCDRQTALAQRPAHANPPTKHRQAISRAWAGLERGDINEALGLLAQVPEIGRDVGWEEEPEVALAALETRVEACLLHGRPQEAMDGLTRALDAAQGAALTVAKRPLLDRIRLGLARTGLRCGRPGTALDLAQGARDADSWLQNTTGVEEGARLAMAACLAEAWTLGTEQEQGGRLNAWTIGQLVAARNSGTLNHRVGRNDLQHIGVSVLSVSLLSGDWKAARDWLEISDRLAGMAPETTMMTAVVQGTIAFNAGDPEYALDLMMPALRQLQHGGGSGQGGVASGVVACCLAEIGRDAEAQTLLTEGRLTAEGTVGRWTVEFHAALCIARIHSRAAGANRMQALAEASRQQGARLLEAHALGMAVVMGQTEMTDRLAECAVDLGGSLGRSFRTLAAGVRENSTGATARALEMLVLDGFRSYGDAAFVEVIGELPVGDKRRIHRAVAVLNGRLLDTVPQALGRQKLVGLNLEGPCGESLTAREREVADMAIQGLSNVQISHRAGVSVRTVEGHLYQVYSKLQIKGRRQLVRLSMNHPEEVGAR